MLICVRGLLVEPVSHVPGYNDMSGLRSDFRVVIRNAHGEYLTENDSGVFFTDDRSQATVFNFRSDQVQEQLDLILKTQGIPLVADPVPLEEIYETCDRCKELFMPSMTFFDGQQFLCPDCRRSRSPRPGINRVA